jgi:hypothetical protein
MSPRSITGRPAMEAPLAAAPARTADEPVEKQRYTIDLLASEHKMLRVWAAEEGLDASLLVRELLNMAGASARIRAEAAAGARELRARRRRSGR